MIQIQCPCCTEDIFIDKDTYRDYPGTVECRKCHSVLEIKTRAARLTTRPIVVSWGDAPKSMGRVPFTDPPVPSQIVDDFEEARRCHIVDAHKGCVVMCRKVLESIALEKGAEGKTLYDKIGNLSQEGLIPSQINEIATQIRTIGNYGAHPNSDGLSDVSMDEAETLLDLTKHIIEYVFVMPYKVSELKTRKDRPE